MGIFEKIILISTVKNPAIFDLSYLNVITLCPQKNHFSTDNKHETINQQCLFQQYFHLS